MLPSPWTGEGLGVRVYLVHLQADLHLGARMSAWAFFHGFPIIHQGDDDLTDYLCRRVLKDNCYSACLRWAVCCRCSPGWFWAL